MHEVLELLKELDKIEHDLDTHEYEHTTPGVIVRWFTRRNEILKILDTAGFGSSMVDDVELEVRGEGAGSKWVVYVK